MYLFPKLHKKFIGDSANFHKCKNIIIRSTEARSFPFERTQNKAPGNIGNRHLIFQGSAKLRQSYG